MPEHYHPKDWSEEEMIDVENLISDALYQYEYDPRRGLNTFVPTGVLYRTYLAHRGTLRDAPPALSRLVFGIILQRIYPFWEKGPDPYRVQRRVNRKRVWGYLGLIGPGCILTNDSPGSPRPTEEL